MERQAALWGQPARRWVAHVDMDAFFASVEQQDDPALRGFPVVVGNSPLPVEKLRELADDARKLLHPPEYIRGVRGVVASASYEARVFGVRSAMPLAKALVLCPDAVVLTGRFGRYRDVAGKLRAVWSEFSPVVEPASLDEAYLDMTGWELTGGTIEEVGRRLKARIYAETGLTASVGLGSSKLVAKIASDLQKPDGLVVVAHGEEARTLAPLPVRALPGVGPRTAEILAALGITRVGDIASTPRTELVGAFGGDHAQSLLDRASGIDDTPVEVPGDPKSISREITLAEDLSDLEDLKVHVRLLGDEVGWSLRQEGFCARCIYIKLRLLRRDRSRQAGGQGFGRLITRRLTLPMATDTGAEIARAALGLLATAHASTGLGSGKEMVRLIGVGVTSLLPAENRPRLLAADAGGAAGTLDTLDEGRDKSRRLDSSVDHIRERFGFEAIKLGAGVKRPLGRHSDGGQT